MGKQNVDNVLYTYEEERMVYASFPLEGIAVAGYDPQCERLFIEFAGDGNVHLFCDVPEQAWYDMRRVESVVRYVRSFLMGKYTATFKKKRKNLDI